MQKQKSVGRGEVEALALKKLYKWANDAISPQPQPKSKQNPIITAADYMIIFSGIAILFVSGTRMYTAFEYMFASFFDGMRTAQFIASLSGAIGYDSFLAAVAFRNRVNKMDDKVGKTEWVLLGLILSAVITVTAAYSIKAMMPTDLAAFTQKAMEWTFILAAAPLDWLAGDILGAIFVGSTVMAQRKYQKELERWRKDITSRFFRGKRKQELLAEAEAELLNAGGQPNEVTRQRESITDAARKMFSDGMSIEQVRDALVSAGHNPNSVRTITLRICKEAGLCQDNSNA